MNQSTGDIPPAGCPPGLWKELCKLIRHPEEFLRENPECFEELKRCWASEQSSSQSDSTACQASHDGRAHEGRAAAAAARVSRG